MSKNYNIVDLFPIPLFGADIPEKFSSITPWFYEQELANGIDSLNYGERSKNSYILDTPECTDLRSYILSLVKEYGDILGYDYTSYKTTQSWLSFKHPGQHHSHHTHPNSLISGVFYFGNISSSTPSIKFSKTTGGILQSFIAPKMVDTPKYPQYCSSEFYVEAFPGRLLLFPSYLTHSVPVNKSNEVRCSLAFNVVPTDGFGDEILLTELKF